MFTKTTYVRMFKQSPFQFTDYRLFGVLFYRKRHQYII